jgi:HSP20 family protein
LIAGQDAGAIRQDVLELFEELAASLPAAERGAPGEYHPSVDVVETDKAVEILVDAAGLPARALRIAFRDGVLLVVGEKAPTRPSGPRSFHLVEREFGRFARAIRLEGAFDVAAARARVLNGELHIVLPKREERRGRSHRIPLTGTGTADA